GSGGSAFRPKTRRSIRQRAAMLTRRALEPARTLIQRSTSGTRSPLEGAAGLPVELSWTNSVAQARERERVTKIGRLKIENMTTETSTSFHDQGSRRREGWKRPRRRGGH